MKRLDLPRIPDWHQHGSCHNQPDWLNKPEALQLADCHTCPVLADCRQWAIDTGCSGVVIGGMRLGLNKTTTRRKHTTP